MRAVEPGDPTSTYPETASRQRWLMILAKARAEELEAAWEGFPEKPRYRLLRAPETGLVMVRGRIGGNGAAFNVGEMTLTRAAVQVLDATGQPAFTGFGHVAGRSRRQAELVALFDALLQDPGRGTAIEQSILRPLAARQQADRARQAARTEATKVEFLTLVRGE